MATETPRPTMADVTSGDDILSVLYGTPVDTWERQLGEVRGRNCLKLLRDAADLCGVDSEGMTRKRVIRAIRESF